MGKNNKEKEFEKVVRYYNMHGEEVEFEHGFLHYFIVQILACIILWIFLPLFYFFTDYFRIKRKVTWKEVKNGKNKR